MIRRLPDDDVRAVQWRFGNRADLRAIVQASRAVARGPVARLVARGARHSDAWTPDKAGLVKVFDAAGLSVLAADGEHGGPIDGPKNLGTALAAFELAWVDAGAATTLLGNVLALAPIHERGTGDQRAHYMRRAAPAQAGDARQPWHGAFVLTEPLPHAGVDTGVLAGKMRIAEWKAGKEPILQIDKRGRFITGMGHADFVAAAVASADARIKGTAFVLIEQNDDGSFDRGVRARKLVHQLASARDPVFSVRVPASRIVGGYTVKDGVLVPNHAHGEIIDAVFRRTRVTVGLMTAAKLLSAVEPVIRYHRSRFRGGDAQPGSRRFELGLQQEEDALHRLVDVWASGEAAASLGFAAARVFDELDPLERTADAHFAGQGVAAGRAQRRALEPSEKGALEYLAELAKPEAARRAARVEALAGDPLVRFVLLDAVASVLGPAVKLWNTGHGSTVMREAVSLMGGHGVTEDCPGFLGYKWMDAQLEATYEGPEAVQRRQLSNSMTDPVFLAQYRLWLEDMRRLSSARPGTGACTLATAMQIWLWTLQHLQHAADPSGAKLYQSSRQGVTFPLADTLAWLLAARQQILDVVELENAGPSIPAVARQLDEVVPLLMDLCHVQAARTAGEVGRICTELLFGYRRHPAWEGPDRASCYVADELDALEDVIPGIAAAARFYSDVVEIDGSHQAKAGPCANTDGLEPFMRMRAKMDGCLTGSRLAKDRAAEALTQVAIADAPGYPLPDAPHA
jgi:Acyl-CoA dehydrogenase, N-terminal domain/Acyl-CoA dehydrogenase, C-terminal domain